LQCYLTATGKDDDDAEQVTAMTIIWLLTATGKDDDEPVTGMTIMWPLTANMKTPITVNQV
jgi:hypothetical protein